MTWRDRAIFALGALLILQAVLRASEFHEAAIGASLIGVPGATKMVTGPKAKVTFTAEASANG